MYSHAMVMAFAFKQMWMLVRYEHVLSSETSALFSPSCLYKRERRPLAVPPRSLEQFHTSWLWCEARGKQRTNRVHHGTHLQSLIHLELLRNILRPLGAEVRILAAFGVSAVGCTWGAARASCRGAKRPSNRQPLRNYHVVSVGAFADIRAQRRLGGASQVGHRSCYACLIP